MNQNIFSEAGEKFLSKKMCIDMIDLNESIERNSIHQLEFFRKLIDIMLSLKIPDNYLDTSDFDLCHEYDNLINTKLLTLADKYKIEDHTMTYTIFDNLRHAFISYKSGGIYNLYKYREAESWYPKIIIQDIIFPNHINTLDKEIQIFRGTSRAEYDSQKFSQSWTTDIKIADKFAFLHYDGQIDYQDTLRVTLETKINNKDIYYFNMDDDESEIIVDESKIIYQNVKIIKEKTL